jgi:integrase
MFINYPKIQKDKKFKYCVSFYVENKRYRLYNGRRIGSKINPNTFPIQEREKAARILAAEVYQFLSKGGVLKEYRSKTIICGELTDLEYLKEALNNKINKNYSNKYVSTLRFLHNEICKESPSKKIESKTLKKIINKYPSNTSKNTIRRHINVLINEAKLLGMQASPMSEIKSYKSKAILHKPFNNIKEILEEINSFNNNLHLCCLITYGCLLRPHREVRELCWSDFTNDLSYIKLSGNRNKSGKNRIVPVPFFIRELLDKKESSYNIFSNSIKANNPDYFKTLWSRFKKQSKLLKEGQTIYSFRHTGVIDVYKRTGSLTKIQQALGHSSLNVSLTYLRGLEVTELNEDDMPRIN